jgi:hypothetical protein|tara:strand:+ start:660 stop:953 length:294 start_codon:yes stop_codon:yes gene_type:complete
MSRYKMVGNNRIELTAEELAELNARETEWSNNNSPFSLAMEDLRSKRNAKLEETDFHGMSDRTMSAEMTTYRQELRDLTNGLTTVADVEAVVFPTKP